MNSILNALKATYNFFAGDAIILTGVALAFILTALLLHALRAPNVVAALVFLVLIAGSLITTLSRETIGRRDS